MSLDQLKMIVGTAYPAYTISDVRTGETPQHAVEITLKRDGKTTRRLFHPFTGEDLGDPLPAGFRFTAWLLDLHDNLLAGETGRRVNGVGALAVLMAELEAATLGLVLLVVAVFLAYNAASGLPFVPVYRVSVVMPNAQRLAPNNEVRIGGSRVGIVESIEPVANPNSGRVAAKLNLKLEEDVAPIPVDSTVAVRSRSALGLKYLEISEGTSSEGFPEGAEVMRSDDGFRRVSLAGVRSVVGAAFTCFSSKLNAVGGCSPSCPTWAPSSFGRRPRCSSTRARPAAW